MLTEIHKVLVTNSHVTSRCNCQAILLFSLGNPYLLCQHKNRNKNVAALLLQQKVYAYAIMPL